MVNYLLDPPGLKFFRRPAETPLGFFFSGLLAGPSEIKGCNYSLGMPPASKKGRRAYYGHIKAGFFCGPAETRPVEIGLVKV